MKRQEDLRGLQLALGMYVLVFALKLAVYFMTGVMALLAEALHTLSDIFISSFLLVAAIYSRRIADKTHMFGYGRVQNVAALVAATLFISFTSYELYQAAIPRLFVPEAAEHRNLTLALGVLVVSMMIAAAPLFKLLTEKKRGAAAHAQLMELLNDEMGLLAALFGTLLIVWGEPRGDPIAAIIVATIIAVNAVGLFRENLSFLLGRSPGPEYLGRLESLARSVPGVIGVHDLRAEYIGPETVHADMHIEVRRGIFVEQADEIAEAVSARLHESTNSGFCTIQVDAVETASNESS